MLQCGFKDTDGNHKVNIMTSSTGNIFRVTCSLCGKYTGQRWISLTKASDAELWCFFDLRLNKQLSKHLRRRWFRTASHWLWRHCNELDGTVEHNQLIGRATINYCTYSHFLITFLAQTWRMCRRSPCHRLTKWILGNDTVVLIMFSNIFYDWE